MNNMKPCTNCGVNNATSQQSGNYIDYGWSFDAINLGYYGGFTDCLPSEDRSSGTVHLCHDCCVRLIEALPGLAAVVEPGGHPNIEWSSSDTEDGTEIPPCCKYAWTWKREAGEWVTYLVNESGAWEKASWEK